MQRSTDTMHDFAQGPHTIAVWQENADTVAAIESLPFIEQLTAGTLSQRAFINYILQDELYLEGYGQAMSLLAARAPQLEQRRFWAESVAEAIWAEQQMHASLLADPAAAAAAEEFMAAGRPQPSPTTLGYTSYLVAQAATAPYEVGVAAVLPCFWVYAHMGKVITARTGDLAGHPFQEWIAAYDSPEFDASTARAVGILEELAAGASAPVRAAMGEAFDRATTYELHFWDSAHRIEDWTLPEIP